MTRYRGTDWTAFSRMEWDILAGLHKMFDAQQLQMRPFTQEHIAISDYVTRPDYYFPAPANVCVYLDGPHHQSSVHAQRDVEISNWLRAKGFFVLRCAYQKYTVGQRNAFLQEICDVVNTRVKQYYQIPTSWRPDQRDE